MHIYRWDMSILFVTWTETNKRTISEMKNRIRSGTKLNYGCIKMPLISLELDHIIPDELHMLLRVTDVLIQNLINAATSDDLNRSGVAQSKVCKLLSCYTKSSGIRIAIHLLQVLEGPMLCQLIEAIRDCGVPFTVTIGKIKNS